MNKIGILTFQCTVNYGAQLQNYALQEYISDASKESEVCVINYDNSTVNSIEKKLFLKDQKSIKEFIKYFKNGRYKKKKWERFELFRNQYINLTELFSPNNISNLDNLIDYYVVGSDQIWNLDITGNDFNYFLDFVSDNGKKFSYAASFGKTSFSDEQLKEINSLLSKFSIINVREKSAENMLNRIGLANVNTVVDPTFLLSKSDWLTRFNLEKKPNDYIFVYMIDNVKENFKRIKKFASRNNLKIVYVNSDFFNVSGVFNDRVASPVDFLNYIYNARYVVTGSFHAICFSIIFNKNFYYILNKNNGRNSRLEDLLNVLKIDDNNNITDSGDITEINLNYDLINSNIDDIIKNSKIIIDSMIKKWSE